MVTNQEKMQATIDNLVVSMHSLSELAKDAKVSNGSAVKAIVEASLRLSEFLNSSGDFNYELGEAALTDAMESEDDFWNQ